MCFTSTLPSAACGARTDRKEGTRSFTHLLQDELLILWGDFLTEMHDEFVRSCLHRHAALWLVGVIADFIPGRVLEKLEMEQPACASYPLICKEGRLQKEG